ncbi:hypothetical protein [Succinimonas sp.]|uniref:hypothetical protein n=1 Tax=Succinimonas sp. TaxID=1936151 RepID=UPI003866B8AD
MSDYPSGFNTAIGYHPMRLHDGLFHADEIVALQYRNRVSPHAALVRLLIAGGQSCFNTAIGHHPMRLLVNGIDGLPFSRCFNTAIGHHPMRHELFYYYEPEGRSFNTAIGYHPMRRRSFRRSVLRDGRFNTAIGYHPMRPS